MNFKDNTIGKKIQVTFATNPNAKKFHFTSDGTAFDQEQDAKNHAKSLKDDFVQEITRAQGLSGQFKTEPDIAAELVSANQAASGKVEDGNDFTDVNGSATDVSTEGAGTPNTPKAPEKKAAMKVVPKTDEPVKAAGDENKGAEDNDNPDTSGDENQVPDATWDIDKIKEWLKENEIKFTHNSKPETLLKKVTEHLAAKK